MREDEGRWKEMHELLTELYGGYSIRSNLNTGRLWNNHRQTVSPLRAKVTAAASAISAANHSSSHAIGD